MRARRTTSQPVPTAGQEWTVPEVGLRLVYVEPGSFRMGSNDGDADTDERPVHDVRLSHRFWMGAFHVTQAEYEAVISSGPRAAPEGGVNPSSFKGARHPVEGVAWGSAMAFCVGLTERERAGGRLPSGYEYRLPTEAEWEFAGRGGTRSQGFTYSGSNSIDEVAWHYQNSGDRRLNDASWSREKVISNHCRTHPVGQKKPNELGLYDMSGNVWEWCCDWGGHYPSGAVTDPHGADVASGHVYRGGSWNDDATFCRVAYRFYFAPAHAYDCLGFRVVLALPVVAAEA